MHKYANAVSAEMHLLHPAVGPSTVVLRQYLALKTLESLKRRGVDVPGEHLRGLALDVADVQCAAVDSVAF